jgi:hypothetical protein
MKETGSRLDRGWREPLSTTILITKCISYATLPEQIIMAIFVFKPALKWGDLQRIKRSATWNFQNAMQGLDQLRE